MSMAHEGTTSETTYGSMPEPTADDSVASGGAPLQPGMPVASREDVIAALRTVHDPEIPVNLYDLGLIYNLDISAEGNVQIEMTLTTPSCPVAGTMPTEVLRAVSALDGVGLVDVKLVWDPPWTMENMSEDAKLALGMD
jgi:FeS assembly SUF system protein